MGKDTNAGTEEAPFATFARAQAAVRGLLASGQHKTAITVVVRGGGYVLNEPIVFGPKDSDDNASDPTLITWTVSRGERALITGGRRITGWTKSRGELWTATVPGVQEGKGYPREFFVDGKRAVRARTPNKDDATPCFQLKGATIAKDLSRWFYEFAPGQLQTWRNLKDVEVVVYGNWEITRKRLLSVDLPTATAALAPPHVAPLDFNAPAAGRWFYFENALEMLDRPGEWYLDRQTGLVTYWPLPGQDLGGPDVIMPVLGSLLEIKGTAARPVRNLHFKGFTFSHTEWTPPAVGYLGIQACHFSTGKEGGPPGEGMISAAIRMESAEACSIEDGILAHLGGAGIEIGPRCRNCQVRGNRVNDIGASGIQIGGPKDEALMPTAAAVSNNHIYNCGVEYPGAVGVWIGFAAAATVDHNEIHDLPYSGISIGWQWNPEPTPVKGNSIVSNHIYNVMTRLGDGGGIYTLGFQPGTVIRGNHIHDVLRSPMCQAAPNNGMFIDEGSKGFRFEQNLIYKTAGEAVRFNKSEKDWHTWEDNVFSGAALPALGSNEKDEAMAKRIIQGAGIEAPYRSRLLMMPFVVGRPK